MKTKTQVLDQFIDEYCLTDIRSCNEGIRPKFLYGVYRTVCPVDLYFHYPVWLQQMKLRFTTKNVSGPDGRLMLMVGLKEVR